MFVRVLLVLGVTFVFMAESIGVETDPPNVIVIMTDDQGYGDLGVHGNPVIQTPALDKFAAESVRLATFYVSPVCAPTRASLLTGRYNYRTGVVDTYLGRAMMYADEVTLAESLQQAGYRTGIFGKWHLGDNYPMRPIDQGFQEAVVHRGGGLAQPSDPPESGPLEERYFDPILEHNGRLEKREGYCSDIFTRAAIDFLKSDQESPFFIYLAFNAPHTPLQVPERDLEVYRGVSFAPDQFPEVGQPIPNPQTAAAEATARVYAMVTNVDRNLASLFATLDAMGLTENTIVVFLTDNGPQQPRFNAGFRGRKGSVYEGGIRVPCYVRWPRRLQAGKVVSYPAAHVDLMPTLLAACGVSPPLGRKLDGLDLMPVLKGSVAEGPRRTLAFQWHRGDWPEIYRSFAIRDHRHKLVGAAAQRGEEESLQLYDLSKDPYETKDLAAEQPQLVAQLKEAYTSWYRDVTSDRQGKLPRIMIGAPEENPVSLTRQDWRGEAASWESDGLGRWDLQVQRPCYMDLELFFPEGSKPELARLLLNGKTQAATLEDHRFFRNCELPAGPLLLAVELQEKGRTFGPASVDLRWRTLSGE